MRFFCLFLSILMTVMLLWGCAGLSDWSYDLLPKDYEIWRVNSQNIVLGRQSGGGLSHTVEPYILRFCSNNTFIAVQRLPLEGLELSAGANVRELDESNREYYLVNTETDIVYGPYTEEEYIQQLTDLSVGELCGWIETYPTPKGAK